ncbi:hypothetical protein IHE45_10G038400 [Dioscorea alata]|uniref:Uncharacterized protein n=1 Tax=Dioscorea alata TaxID=55571 RepID=A0ACB7VAP3_DIOAL|nr:hypothetical protein IHE45_10G038400 [Dioscorea alata]
MERNGSFGATWADQWDYGGDSAHGGYNHNKNNNKKNSGLEKTKAVASTGLQKTKAVASTGFKKVKEGTTLGFHWIKDKYQKKTQKD